METEHYANGQSDPRDQINQHEQRGSRNRRDPSVSEKGNPKNEHPMETEHYANGQSYPRDQVNQNGQIDPINPVTQGEGNPEKYRVKKWYQF